MNQDNISSILRSNPVIKFRIDLQAGSSVNNIKPKHWADQAAMIKDYEMMTHIALRRSGVKRSQKIRHPVGITFQPVIKSGKTGPTDWVNYSLVAKSIEDAIVTYGQEVTAIRKRNRKRLTQKIVKRGLLYDDSAKYVRFGLIYAPVKKRMANESYILVSIYRA